MDNTFTIRLAGTEDAVKVHDIMVKAYESLSDKSFFICDDLPYVENIINNPQEGFALLCMADDKPAGTLLVRLPGLKEDNLGRDLMLGEDKIMNVETIIERILSLSDLHSEILLLVSAVKHTANTASTT